MIRFLLRFLGLLCLAAAFILVIYDGTKSIAGNALYITSVRGLWQTINAASLQNLQSLIVSKASFLWDPLMVALLAAPSWALLGLIGVVLITLGRRKKPLIGYAR